MWRSATQAWMIEDGNLFVNEWNPRGIFHHNIFRFLKKPRALSVIHAGNARINPAIELWVVVEGGVVTVSVGDSLAVEQDIQEIARVRIILHPTEDPQPYLITSLGLCLKGAVEHWAQIDLNADLAEVL